jgi:hypothetical protein
VPSDRVPCVIECQGKRVPSGHPVPSNPKLNQDRLHALNLGPVELENLTQPILTSFLKTHFHFQE